MSCKRNTGNGMRFPIISLIFYSSGSEEPIDIANKLRGTDR